MLLVVLLVALARAEWVEITQLHKPTQLDTLEFHDEKRRPSSPKESLDDGKRTRPLSSTDHFDLYDEKRHRTQFSTTPYDIYDGKMFKPHFSTDAYEDNKRMHIQFSTEPGFLADHKRNRIYINHTIDHSMESHWSKGVVHRVPDPTVGTVKRIYLTTEEPAKVKYEETDLTHELTRGHTMRNPFKTFEDRKPEFVTKEETFEDDDQDEVHFIRKPPKHLYKDYERPKNHAKDSPIRRVDLGEADSVTVESVETTSKMTMEEHREPTTSDAKPNTMEHIVKFAKVVADTISRNTRRSVGSKLRYLEDLKDTIMVNIEDRIESLWPDDTGGGAARRRRWSRSAEARGHVEFPSSESALMTISFLTFAVYLIKLVLQVIQTYKNKTMMVTPAVFAAVGKAAGSKQQHTLK